MNHEIVIYKYDTILCTYRRCRSQWVTNRELHNIQVFVQNNRQIEGFYRYRIAEIRFHSMHCDLIGWVNYLANRMKLHEIFDNNINLI